MGNPFAIAQKYLETPLETQSTEVVEKGPGSEQERLEPATAEAIAAQVLAEYEPSEVNQIVREWRKLGNRLDPETVRLHLAALRKWQSQWRDNG